jgi:hypothetical protein
MSDSAKQKRSSHFPLFHRGFFIAYAGPKTLALMANGNSRCLADMLTQELFAKGQNSGKAS